LIFVAKGAMLFSLPLATAIEACLFLKKRKGEAKGNERGNRRQGRQSLMKRFSNKMLVATSLMGIDPTKSTLRKWIRSEEILASLALFDNL